MKKYKTYQIVVIIIGLFLCFFGRFIPVSSGLSASGAQTLFIMVGGLLMASGGRGLTSLAVILALALIPELGMNKVAAGTLGNSTVFYLLLCFMLAKSLQATSVAHRLAVWFLTGSFSRKGAWCTIAMIFVSIFVLSSGLSSSSTIMIFLPILYEIFESLGYEKGKGDIFPRGHDRQPGHHLPDRPGYNADLPRHDPDRFLLLQQLHRQQSGIRPVRDGCDVGGILTAIGWFWSAAMYGGRTYPDFPG